MFVTGSRRLNVNRRSLLKAGMAAGAVSALGAPAILRAEQPITIGLQTELTGILTTYGYWYEKAARAAVERINKAGGIAGRPVTLAVENTASKVEIGVATVEKLVKQHNADFLLGALHTGVAVGSAKMCRDLNTVYFACAKADEVTGDQGNRFVFRTCSNSEMEAQATTDPKFIEQLGKTWSIIYADYSWGQSHLKVWKPRLEAAGATIVSEVGVPLGTADILPFLAKIDRSSEAVLVALFTSDAIGFTTQLRAMGMEFQVVGVQGLDATIDKTTLKDAAGFYVPHSLPRELQYKDTQANRDFRAALGVDEAGKEISSDRWIAESYYWSTWEYVNLIKNRVEATGWSSRADNPKFIESLEGFTMEESLDFPQGTKTIRAQDHQAFLDIYVSKITDDGRPEVLRKVDPKESTYPAHVDYRTQAL